MRDMVLPELPGGAARVLRWLAAPGAALAAGAPLLIVRTELAELALPAPAPGELAEILVPSGESAAPGQALARLRPRAVAEPPPPARATPLARRIAQVHGIDLAGLAGGGPNGRLRKADILALVGPPAPPEPPPGKTEIGSLKSERRSGVCAISAFPRPLASATILFDAGAALAAGAGQSAELPAMLVAAIAQSLTAHPLINARWSDAGPLLRRRCHLALATPEPAGYRWALVGDAGDLTLGGVARALAAPPRAEAPAEASLAVFCLAEGAAWHSAPPPLPGHTAAVCVGAPRSQPVARGDGVAVRPIASLSICYDARALDHAQAVAFIQSVARQLEQSPPMAGAAAATVV